MYQTIEQALAHYRLQCAKTTRLRHAYQLKTDNEVMDLDYRALYSEVVNDCSGRAKIMAEVLGISESEHFAIEEEVNQETLQKIEEELSEWKDLKKAYLYLAEFYAPHNPIGIEDRMKAINDHLGGESSISSATGEVTLIQKLRVLEVELLEKAGIQTCTLVC
jgi:hypothetical protein